MKTIELEGAVVMRYPRYWWHLWSFGWHRHVDGLGRRCWIRYWWSEPADEKGTGWRGKAACK